MKYRLLIVLMSLTCLAEAQLYTRQDTLRGSNGRGRSWWDVLKYDLTIEIDTASKSITGINTITFRIINTPTDSMQIDMQEGMSIPDHWEENLTAPEKVKYPREGNVFWLPGVPKQWKKGEVHSISIAFKGKPRQAVHPPWDGGFIWGKDSLGRPWTAVACQGTGASCWWPCKDYQGDEPDSGMSIKVLHHSRQDVVANGHGSLYRRDTSAYYPPVFDTLPFISQKTHAWEWQVARPGFSNKYSVKNPINSYDATFYIGDYGHWHDTLHGEKGILDLDFYPLSYNESRAHTHWAVSKQMLHCFEYWMGPYPFYEDGYKLVEAPYLGMEHQSAVAYGNLYKMGYLGMDRSRTGVGLSFDFIIVHESGHEWFGNNITARDVADNWIHEGFTTYVEALFAEWIKGRDSGFAYAVGSWRNIRNDKPVIGDYGVNNEGSGDMYNKGAAIVHMVRMMLHDDAKFRQLLRGLNKDFYHKIVTSKQVEDYISHFTGRNLTSFFNNYLRKADLPVVQVVPNEDNQGDGKVLKAKLNNDDNMVLPVYTASGKYLFDLSRKQVAISRDDLKALGNYLVVIQEAPESRH